MQDTQQETSIGTQLAQEAGSALESIFSVIERQGHEIESINTVAAQQFQSSRMIMQTMQTVSHSTQRSNQSAHNVAQSMERLARLAEQLLGSVEVFKLPEQPDYSKYSSVASLPPERPATVMAGSGPLRSNGFPPPSPLPGREIGGARPKSISRPLRQTQPWPDRSQDRRQ
jgi:hypothetical protein